MLTNVLLSAVLALTPAQLSASTPDDITLTSEQAINFLQNHMTADNPDPHHGQLYSGNRTNLFGSAWKDVDHNKCDTRNDILSRDLFDTDYSEEPGIQDITQGVKKGKSGCRNATVYSGKLNDPYTGKIIDFKRGKESGSKVQIDHVIPLGYAYRHGAWAIAKNGGKNVMEQFANDPLNLLAVDGKANNVKKDKGPSEWMPDNSAFKCEYALRMTAVLQRYNSFGFTFDDKDKSTLIGLFHGECAGKSFNYRAPMTGHNTKAEVLSDSVETEDPSLNEAAIK